MSHFYSRCEHVAIAGVGGDNEISRIFGKRRPSPQMTDQSQERAAFVEKRNLILAHAVRLFAAQGYAATEMEAISAAAGVAKGSLYRYFKGKEDLFLAAADSCLEQLAEFVFESIACLDDPVAMIRTAFRAIARFCEKRPEVMEIMAQERAIFRRRQPARTSMHRERNRPIFTALVQRGIDEGRFRQVDPDEVVQTFLYLMNGLILTARLEGTEHKLSEQADRSVQYLLHGILKSPE